MKIIIVSFLFSVAVLRNSIYSIILPFFPIITKEKGISITVSGIVLSSYAIGNFSTIFFIKYLFKYKKKLIVLMGFFFLMINLIIFGSLIFVTNKTYFKVIAIIARFFQGIATSIITATTNSFFPLLFKSQEELTKIYSIYSLLAFLGLAIGPFVGGSLFNYFGYFYVNLLFAVIIFLFFIISLFIDFNEQELMRTEDNEILINKNYALNILDMLKCYLPLLYGIIWLVIGCNFIGLLTFLASYLRNEFKISKDQSTMIIGIANSFCVIYILLYYFFLSKINSIFLARISIVISLFGLILIGPIRNFNEFNKLWVILLGYSINNLSVCFMSFLSFVIITEKLKKYHSNFGLVKISNFASFFILISWSGAEFFGPIIMGSLYDNLNFKKAIEVVLIIEIIFFIFFFVFEKFYEIHKNKKNNENINEP